MGRVSAGDPASPPVLSASLVLTIHHSKGAASSCVRPAVQICICRSVLPHWPHALLTRHLLQFSPGHAPKPAQHPSACVHTYWRHNLVVRAGPCQRGAPGPLQPQAPSISRVPRRANTHGPEYTRLERPCRAATCPCPRWSSCSSSTRCTCSTTTGGPSSRRWWRARYGRWVGGRGGVGSIGHARGNAVVRARPKPLVRNVDASPALPPAADHLPYRRPTWPELNPSPLFLAPWLNPPVALTPCCTLPRYLHSQRIPPL